MFNLRRLLPLLPPIISVTLIKFWPLVYSEFILIEILSTTSGSQNSARYFIYTYSLQQRVQVKKSQMDKMHRAKNRRNLFSFPSAWSVCSANLTHEPRDFRVWSPVPLLSGVCWGSLKFPILYWLVLPGDQTNLYHSPSRIHRSNLISINSGMIKRASEWITKAFPSFWKFQGF